ncbi:MAG: hypothetical protein ACE5PM_04595 [Candidatus Hydrothermarchaeales archaeon]
MGKSIKSIVEQWKRYWKDNVGLYESLDEHVEINDDLKTYIIKKKKGRGEV